VKLEGACPCRGVRYAIDGPVRDILVCHCSACCSATGAPWAASAALRADVTVADPGELVWAPLDDSASAASEGRCRTCGTRVFWDAPGRDTVSFAAATLEDVSALQIAGHLWVGTGDRAGPPSTGAPSYPEGVPSAAAVPWHA
jgi:hypothetical protein